MITISLFCSDGATHHALSEAARRSGLPQALRGTAGGYEKLYPFHAEKMNLTTYLTMIKQLGRKSGY